MFSGIVEGQATLSSKKEEKSIVRMEFKTTGFNPADLDLGASIAINGVCLTATSLNKDSFSVDVSTETLKCTNIGELEVEDVVNIEQSLKIGDSIDGHFVFGHVDEVSTVQNIEVLYQTKIFHFSLSQEIPLTSSSTSRVGGKSYSFAISNSSNKFVMLRITRC